MYGLPRVRWTHLVTPVVHFNVFAININLVSGIIDNGSYKGIELQYIRWQSSLLVSLVLPLGYLQEVIR